MALPGTVSGYFVTTSYFTTINVYRLIESALKALDETKNPGIKSDASNLLITLVNTIKRLQGFNYDFENLPTLQVENIEDDSVLIEWIFDDFRVGFTIEKNKDESGWYLVTTKRLGFINASGYFLDTEREKLLNWLVIFVKDNS